MPYLEGVTVRTRKRLIDCNKCPNLNEKRICRIFDRHIRRTVDYCRFFPLNDVIRQSEKGDQNE